VSGTVRAVSPAVAHAAAGPAAERLIVALDVDSLADAERLLDQLAGIARRYKIGSQLFTASGPAAVDAVQRRGGAVFLDLKFHDIPNTVAGAVASAARLGVSLITVHGLGGRAMLEAAAGAIPAMGTRLLAITVLTSHDEKTLGEVGVGRPLGEEVRELARLARSAGIDGVVASPHEVPLLREACGKDMLIVTPGIRPAGARSGDQARAATPAAALAAGADYLVVGRPITEARDPAAAARVIGEEMEAHA
jgi:orotidine-5'-phosphate decarboxylase